MTAGRSRKLRAETTESHVATLIRDSGYHAFVVDRLVRQAAALTGASTACLLVRYPERSPEAVVAATFGMPPDVIASVVELGKRGAALIEGAASAQIFSAGGVRGQL